MCPIRQLRENLLETWFLLGDGSWWTPSQPSMQPMQQNAVLPPGGSMPQMMQTLVCRCVKTKIQVGVEVLRCQVERH